jgi:hypothetical protein
MTHADLLRTLEIAIDASFSSFDVPTRNLWQSRWLLLTAAEDILRNLMSDMDNEDGRALIETVVDRFKYGLKYALVSLDISCRDRSIWSHPFSSDEKSYVCSHALIMAGIEFAAGSQICILAHSGDIELEQSGSAVSVSTKPSTIDPQYGAMEILRQQPAVDLDFASILYTFLRTRPDDLPSTFTQIVDSARLKNRRVLYHYEVVLANLLAHRLPQQPTIAPASWIFPWGDRDQTTLLSNALSLRCLYHLIAVHGVADRRQLVGGAEDCLCLVLPNAQLVADLELMSSLRPDRIKSFVDAITYGNNTANPDPALQPILAIGAGRVAIPCIHILTSNLERNYLSLQSRTDTANFDRQSKVFEAEMIADLLPAIRSRWPHSLPNVEFGLKNVTEEIDICCVDSTSRTILLIELRWMIPPGDPREIQNRRRACLAKTKQIGRKCEYARKHIAALLSKLGLPTDGGPWVVRGLVVIEGFGGTRSNDPSYPIIPTYPFRIGLTSLKNLAEFHDWIASFVWLPQEGLHFEVAQNSQFYGEVELLTPGIARLGDREAYQEYLSDSLAR